MKIQFFIGFIFLTSLHLYAQVDPVDKNGVAIAGYDVVSYFSSDKPLKGNQQFKANYKGVVYYFSSEENLKLFKATPQKYVPQYDGYCALAVSYGKKISIDPLTYKVTGDRLFLFYNGKTSRGKINSLDIWNRNEAKLLKKTEALWPDVRNASYKSEDTL